MSTTSAPLRAGYNAAITKILELKMPNVEKRNLELTKILKEGLSSIDGINILTPLDGNECSALTTFRLMVQMNLRQYYSFGKMTK